MSETTSSRLLTLLSLLQGRRDWPGSELADRLEVSPRTIRRDVERLRTLGYPVESMTGPAGGYQLRAGTAMPPLLLDDDEAIAIAVGLRTAAGGVVTGIEETAVRALVKLEQVLPAHLRRRVQALRHATQTLQVYGGPDGRPAVPDRARRRRAATTSACASPTPRATAPAAAARPSRTRSSTPAAAGTSSPGTAGASDWRTFRVDRIAQARLDRRALHAARRCPAKDAAAYVAAEPAVLPRALRGARDRRRARRRARRAGAGSAATSRRSTRTAARCARATTTSTGWRCGSR